MLFGNRNVMVIFCVVCLLLIDFDGFTGKAGSLEPSSGPKPTMVTLGQLSAQIEALSSPVKKVVRGAITIRKYENTGWQDLSSPVDPSRSVVLLSEPVASDRDSSPTSYREWIARTGACLISLTEGRVIVQVESQPALQKVGYQIIEYR